MFNLIIDNNFTKNNEASQTTCLIIFIDLPLLIRSKDHYFVLIKHSVFFIIFQFCNKNLQFKFQYELAENLRIPYKFIYFNFVNFSNL